jgi:hypothetical protein
LGRLQAVSSGRGRIGGDQPAQARPDQVNDLLGCGGDQLVGPQQLMRDYFNPGGLAELLRGQPPIAGE